MKSIKKYVTIIFTIFLSFSVYAQSVDATTQILETEEVTYGQVCYLAASQQGFIDDDASYYEAFNIIKNKGQLPQSANSSNIEENNIIKIKDIAYILSHSFDVKGGVMYRLTKGCPRYAFKQFQADRIVKSDLKSDKNINGLELFNIFTNCINTYTDFDINAISMENE